MTLGELFLLLLRALGLTSTVLGIVTAIENLLKPSEGGDTYSVLTSNVRYTKDHVDNLATLIGAVALEITDAETAILAAVALTQQTGHAVTLPTVPPSGYGAVPAGDIADSVWNATPASYGRTTMGASLMEAGAFAGAFVEPSIALTGGYWVPDGVTAAAIIDIDGFAPNFDVTNILPGDDLLSCLTRQNPTADGLGWNDGMGGHVACTNSHGNPQEWVTTIDQSDFLRIKALLYPTTAVVQAPIWPGLSGVTLLTPVAFSDSFTISEAMEGCLIEITTAPSKQGTFDFDGLVSYRNAGALAFLSDDGEAELSQPLGFTTAVYLCRTMVQASGVKVRVTPGLGGTLTPFTIP